MYHALDIIKHPRVMSQEDSKVHFFPHFAMMRLTHFTMVFTCTVLLNTRHRMLKKHPAPVTASVCWRYLNRNPMDHWTTF